MSRIIFTLGIIFLFGCSENIDHARPTREHYKIDYYDSGEVRSKKKLVNGKGSKVYFFKTGDTLSIVKYQNGLKHGLCTEYYPNGNIRTKIM